MPYIGEFHFTALRTLATLRVMSASRRFPRSRFQPGIAAMYACTGASPSAFAICGLPPERRTTFWPFRTLIGRAFAPAFGEALAAGLRALARDARLAFALAPSSTRFIWSPYQEEFLIQWISIGLWTCLG